MRVKLGPALRWPGRHGHTLRSSRWQQPVWALHRQKPSIPAKRAPDQLLSGEQPRHLRQRSGPPQVAEVPPDHVGRRAPGLWDRRESGQPEVSCGPRPNGESCDAATIPRCPAWSPQGTGQVPPPSSPTSFGAVPHPCHSGLARQNAPCLRRDGDAKNLAQGEVGSAAMAARGGAAAGARAAADAERHMSAAAAAAA